MFLREIQNAQGTKQGRQINGNGHMKPSREKKMSKFIAPSFDALNNCKIHSVLDTNGLLFLLPLFHCICDILIYIVGFCDAIFSYWTYLMHKLHQINIDSINTMW